MTNEVKCTGSEQREIAGKPRLPDFWFTPNGIILWRKDSFTGSKSRGYDVNCKRLSPYQKTWIFTKAEAAEMLRCLQDEDLQFQTFIQLAIITGARRGEMAALKFSDFDYDKCQLTISRAAVKLKDQPILIKPPKDYEIRTVTVNRHCIQLVQMLEAHYESEKQRLGNKWVIFRIKTKQRPNSKSEKIKSPQTAYLRHLRTLLLVGVTGLEPTASTTPKLEER